MKMVAGMRSTGAGVVVLSCSDPRLNPYQILGIDQTLKATMVRNAGGRAFDAIRTLSVLQTIGSPGTIVVMHHTGGHIEPLEPVERVWLTIIDCGMTHFNDSDIKKALLEIAPSDEVNIKAASFGGIIRGVEESVREDVALLKASPWIKDSTNIVGLKYDIDTGLLSEVSEGKSEL